MLSRSSVNRQKRSLLGNLPGCAWRSRLVNHQEPASYRRLAGPGVGERLRECREPGLPSLPGQIRGALGSTHL